MATTGASGPWLRASHPAMLRLSTVALLLAVAVAGCAPDPSPSAAPTDGAAPAGIGETRYTCGGSLGFLPIIFDQPATAETEGHPSAAALQAAIADVEPDLDILPATGYWLASRNERQALYLARAPGDAEADFVFALFQNRGTGWVLSGWGGCQPQIILEGFSLATWVLDPELPAPDAETTTFTALVMERMCASGKAMGARLQPPSITYGEDSVVVVFAAIPLGGDFQTCQSNPSMRAVVELREPIGARELLNGAFFPPAEPVAPEF